MVLRPCHCSLRPLERVYLDIGSPIITTVSESHILTDGARWVVLIVVVVFVVVRIPCLLNIFIIISLIPKLVLFVTITTPFERELIRNSVYKPTVLTTATKIEPAKSIKFPHITNNLSLTERWWSSVQLWASSIFAHHLGVDKYFKDVLLPMPVCYMYVSHRHIVKEESGSTGSK